MSAEKTLVLTTPPQMRGMLAGGVFVVGVILLCFPGIPWGFTLSVIAAVVTYFLPWQRFEITPDGVTYKYFNRIYEFPFAKAEFRFERVLGPKSWMYCLRPDGYELFVTIPGQAEQRIRPWLSEYDAEQLLAILREQGKI